MSNEMILVLLIIVIILNIAYLLYYYGFKVKKAEDISKKQKQGAILNGAFVIISFLIIVLYELVEYKYAVSLHPYFGNILTSIKYIACFILIITVTLGQIYYKRYMKVLPNYINIIYQIGLILLIILASYIYIGINIEISNAVLM